MRTERKKGNCGEIFKLKHAMSESVWPWICNESPSVYNDDDMCFDIIWKGLVITKMVTVKRLKHPQRVF